MDWILSIATLIGLWLIGNKSNKGNALMIAIQVLWIWFAIDINKKGLLLLAIALFLIYARNWWRWKRDSWTRIW